MNEMLSKLIEYRVKTCKVVESDRMENLNDLSKKVDLLKRSSIEFYGYRQLPFMMKSFFFQQQLVNTGFSISEYVADMLAR